MSEIATASPDLTVLDGVELRGNVNVPDPTIVSNVKYAITLGFPQAQPQALVGERVLLVGGGPSLDETADELFDLYADGAKIVTVNGGYGWCLKNRLKPSAQIVVDARPRQGHFLQPAISTCKYLIASQCDPTTWDAVDDGRENVWIWHAADAEGLLAGVLDEYYFGHWHGVGGGTTVAMRGLALLRTLGFYRFDLFGIDSCWLGDAHHAFPQPQNDRDQRFPFTAWPTGSPERARKFSVSLWHLKQLEDFLQLIRIAGDQFLINVHGQGLLAFALEEAAAIEWAVPETNDKGEMV